MTTETKLAPAITAERATFAKLFAQAGDTQTTNAKRGEALKRQTEKLLAYPNGFALVCDAVREMVSAHVKAHPRPAKPAACKRRTDDAACAAWDKTLKLMFQNPGLQVCAAMEAAKCVELVSITNEGEVKTRKAPEGKTPATVNTVKKLLERLPYTATAEQALALVVKAWVDAGKLKAAAPIVTNAPTVETVAPPATVETVETVEPTEPTLADVMAMLAKLQAKA